LPPTERLSQEQIQSYLSHLENYREPWQIKQAGQALRRYDYFLTREHPSAIPFEADADGYNFNQLTFQGEIILLTPKL